METILKLPYPPSTNKLWRYFRGRVVLSKEAQMYIKDVGYLVARVQPYKKSSRLQAEMIVHAKDNRKRDLDNCFKIVLDSLEKAGIFENDSQFDELTISRGENYPSDSCIIVIIRELT